MGLDSWARTAVTTINKHIRRLSEPMFMERYLMAAMRSRGRMTFNNAGKKFDWRVKKRQIEPSPITDEMAARAPKRTNIWEDAELPYRGYGVEEAFSKFEKLANGSTTEGLIKIVSKITESMMEDMRQYFGDQLYVDGTTAANANKIHGLRSVITGATADGKAATNVQADYAGLSTVRGAYGGTWSGTWPDGNPSVGNGLLYEFWTPIIWDYTDTLWTEDTKDWPNTYREVLEHAVIHGQKRRYKFDAFILATDLYLQLLYALEAKESIEIRRGGADSLAIKLGFDALNFMGVDIVQDFGVPSTEGWGITLDQLTLRSMQNQLFEWDKDRDWYTRADLVGIDFYGNLQIHTPRAICWFDGIT